MERLLCQQVSSSAVPLFLQTSHSRLTSRSSDGISSPTLPQHGFHSSLPCDAPKFGSSISATSKNTWDYASPDQFWEANPSEEGTTAIVHIGKDVERTNQNSYDTLSEEVAMGLVLRAASGTGWTTGSGLKGPSNTSAFSQTQFSREINDQPLPLFSKSPRRRMRVAFTCNICGARTTRAINPHAYTDGTIFVQCGGCDIIHKLVDNLKLFHELRGSIFPTGVRYGDQDFRGEHKSYDILGLD